MTRHDPPPAGVRDYCRIPEHNYGVWDATEKTAMLRAGDKLPNSYGSIGGGGEEPLHNHCNNLPQPAPSSTSITTTPTRFWVLAVFSILSWVEGMQWNTWGPISESMEAAFPGWGSSTVAMMSGWGTTMFVVFVFPMCWATLRYGLRSVVVASAVLIFLGTALRCLTRALPTFTIMCHVCAALVGVSSTLVLSAPTLIACDWFPAHERTTALAVMLGASQLSGLGSFLEPLLVRLPGPHVSPLDIQTDVMKLLYIDAGVAGVLLLAILVYFPSKPSRPPSLTSTTTRLDLIPGLCTLVRNRRWLGLVLTYGAVVGPAIGWLTVLNYSLIPLGLHQDETMWIGQATVLVSSVSPLVSGRFTDLVQGHVRASLVGLMLATTVCFYWFLLLSYGVLPFTKWQVYVSVVGGVAFNYATIPLFYEMGIDLAYPAPEILVSGAITAADNLTTTLFLSIFFIPNVGYQWVTYTLVLSTSVTIIPLFFIKFRYTRSSIDSPDD
ncbi:solute carrier family 49 member 4 homolog [Procambarus clarkii]|uniref:solute carrier family 49 member 4 homolog n=1 Tax=Procambarus clarkii TaxID=6728 RepID=UPI003742E152